MAEEIVQQMRIIQEVVCQLDIRLSDNRSEITNQYGYLKFDMNELSSITRLSQYIRLSHGTSARTIVEFMRRGWRLPTPDLIISVTGGGKQCNMSTHLRKTFQRGLVAAAATTNAWLITAGTNAGVIKEVGKALDNYRYKNRKHALDVPCIGIGSWKHTAGTEQLNCTSNIDIDVTIDRESRSANHSRQSTTEAVHMNVADEYNIRSYCSGQSENGQCDLEPNHTHFLLFEGESCSAEDVLLRRTEIEQHLREINTTLITTDILTPIVMILVEGGALSIRAVCQALETNVPLVVVKESGRAADLVADLYTYFNQIEIDHGVSDRRFINKDRPTDISYKEIRLNSILHKHRADNNVWIDQIKERLCNIMNQRRHLITIFKFDSERHHGNLEDAILEALFNAAKFSEGIHNEQQCRVAELKLAMAWQKLDYAQKHILTDRTISKWERDDLRRALLDAFRRGHVDFVELLIEYGASLEKLTINDIEQLYETVDADNGLPVENKLKPTRDDYYSIYFNKQFHVDSISSDKNCPLGQNARRELFLWSIFVDRFELAKYLCSKTWNQSVAALIGARIYRLAAQTAIHSETKDEYEKNAEQFDNYAMLIIDRCFDNDEYFAVELLKQNAAAFDNVDPLKVAQEANCRIFLASKCVQRYLDNQWFGNINYKRKAINFRVFLVSLFIPLMPLFSVFLPYVQERKEIVSYGKSGNGVIIRTVIKSDHDVEYNRVRWSDKFIYFYQAPIVRFYYNMIFYILFLGLFSYVLLINFFPWNIMLDNTTLSLGQSEIILHIWIWSLILEEIHKFYLMENHEYFYDVWNLIRLTAIVLYLIGFMTRFVLIEAIFTISKIFLCIDLIVWFVGTLHLFTAFERLGPKLLMILNTMKDLLFFICFILIFLCGFSIASWSLINTKSQINWIYDDHGNLLNITVNTMEHKSWSWQLIKDIINHGIWKVFGQIDPIHGTDSYSNIAFVLAIIFVAIANVLLLNVLVALFNVTIQNVQEQAHDLWRYQRFLIVNEYSKKTPVPPPFNTIYYLFIALRHVVRLCHNFSDVMQRESAIADDFWRYALKHAKKNHMDMVLENIERKIDYVRSHVQNTNKHNFNNRYMSDESDV
ncbi:unnamed protein product [Adineta steineri]|uniref:Uncharacterized protein n=1 Tax=Adineta steineri TaxID=433720 RepID=A0A814H5W5_9BILA|nr:unnamed protein product [Adineta steineri]